MFSQAKKRERTGAEEFREPIATTAASWTQITVFLVITGALLVLVPLARQTPLGAPLRGPAWWENLNLFTLLVAVTVGGILLLWCRFRLSDLGLRRDKLAQGILVFVIFWGVLQIWPFVASGSGELATTWTDPGVLATLRWTVVMFLATALWEEIAFRGFLLPQIYLKLPGKHVVRVIAALLLSQFIFAISHVPSHILINNLSAGEVVQTTLLQGLAGLMLGLLYLRTRNLWIVIGIHGLANAPTPLIGGAMGWELPLLSLMVAWPWLVRSPKAKGLAPVRNR